MICTKLLIERKEGVIQVQTVCVYFVTSRDTGSGVGLALNLSDNNEGIYRWPSWCLYELNPRLGSYRTDYVYTAIVMIVLDSLSMQSADR